MSQQILSQSKLYAGAFDFSGDLKGIALRLGADQNDTTTFSSGGVRTRTPGLKTAAFQLDGLWNVASGAIATDDQLFGNIAAGAVPVTIAPQTGAEGEVSYILSADFADYAPGGKVGEMLAFTASGEAAGNSATAAACARATLLRSALAAIVATGNGTIYNLGAVSASQKLYAALHVLAMSSSGTPALDVKIQSAALVGFGSPTDRITFSTLAAVGSQWATPVAGPITDAYWRCVVTLTNITSVTLAVSAGIL